MTGPMLIQCTASVLSIIVLAKSISMRSVPKVRYFMPLALAVFFYATGYLMELDSHSLEAALLSQEIQYYGVSCYAVLYFLFVRDFGNRPVRGAAKVGALFVFPAVALVLVYAWPDSTLFYDTLSFSTQPSAHLVIGRGPLFLPHVLYSFALMGLSVYEIARYFPRATPTHRRMRGMFLAATTLPCIATMVLVVDVMPVSMEFGSLALVLALLVLGSYLLRRGAQDWLPFARERVVEAMNDGFVLLDNDMNFMDANEVAKTYYPTMGRLAPGDPIDRVPALSSDFIHTAKNQLDEIILHAADGVTLLRATVTPISYNGQQTCQCVMLYDVTEQHKLMTELEQLATMDTLTGLLNRAMFFKVAARDFDLALRNGHDAVILMMDIDHFKDVNDTYGHQKGDEVLQAVTAIIRERLRSTDVGGRYGGEEFCVLLPATGTWGAMRLANEIRGFVQRARFEAGGQPFSVTLSVGIAQLDATRHSHLDDLIADADTALYTAKAAGRNRAVPYHPLLASDIVVE